ncbi:hypothetical protein D3C75_1202340 [compost metagenome]
MVKRPAKAQAKSGCSFGLIQKPLAKAIHEKGRRGCSALEGSRLMTTKAMHEAAMARANRL